MKPPRDPRGGFARRRKKAEEAGCRVASGICNQHSRGSSDVTSGHLLNKRKPRNRTLSEGNDFEKEGVVDVKHVSRETNMEAWQDFVIQLVKIKSRTKRGSRPTS